MFLKMMVHSMSSPANTVESFHCTKTRMVEDMVGMGFGGGARAVAACAKAEISWAGSNNSGNAY